MFNSRDFFSAKINTREEMSVDALTCLDLSFVPTDKKRLTRKLGAKTKIVILVIRRKLECSRNLFYALFASPF